MVHRNNVTFQFFAFILDSVIVFGGRSLNSLGKYWFWSAIQVENTGSILQQRITLMRMGYSFL